MKQRFEDFDQLLARIDEIQSKKHRNTGKWTTAQIFYHLGEAFLATSEGQRAARASGRRFVMFPLRWFFTRVGFLSNLPIPPSVAGRLEPPADVELAEEHAKLVQAIGRFRQSQGPHPAHPVLGPFNHEQWVAFHLRHCEHHLSFIETSE